MKKYNDNGVIVGFNVIESNKKIRMIRYDQGTSLMDDIFLRDVKEISLEEAKKIITSHLNDGYILELKFNA